MSIGSCDGAVREAIDVLARQKIAVDYMRIKAFPFGHEVESFLSLHATIFVVEQNRDAQLRSLLTLETAVEKSKLKSILSYSGFPMSCEPIVDGIRSDACRCAAAIRGQPATLTSTITENIMSFINKPKVAHPSLPTNALGLTRRQYEGSMSTLCAGCGHDSITAAIIEACWGLDMRPEQLVKLSGSAAPPRPRLIS